MLEYPWKTFIALTLNLPICAVAVRALGREQRNDTHIAVCLANFLLTGNSGSWAWVFGQNIQITMVILAKFSEVR